MKRVHLKKLVVVAILALIGGAFFYFDLSQYLSLEYLKQSQARFQELYAANRVAVIAAYMATYILIAALSLPGAGIMTVAGGGFFGLLVGTVAASVASTVGALLACLVARTLLRDWVQKKFADRLAIINRGVEKEGSFYLFSVRLIPLFPFFIINVVMGLTQMRLFTFCWVSQLGMLPATIVYVNAGKELAKIDSLSGILSPSLLASFVLLGLFPITVKKLMHYIRPRFVAQAVTNEDHDGQI